MKHPIQDMDGLRETAKKTFGDKIDTDEQKYFYYDSDEDRIEISDDEELETAMNHCTKKCLKIHIENYDSKSDPFFQSISFLKSEKDTGPSTGNRDYDAKMSDLISSGRSYANSLTSSVCPQEQPDEEYQKAFNSIEETISCDEESEGDGEDSYPGEKTSEKIEFDNQEVKSDGKMIGQSQNFTSSLSASKAPQRKNTETEERPEMLEERKKDFRSNSLPRESHLKASNSLDLEPGSVPGISKELQEHLQSEEFRELKKEWQFQVKAEKCYDKEYDRRRYTGFDKVYSKIRVASGNTQERGKLAEVEDSEPKVSNEDVILCKKGSLISKSWIVKNVGCTIWPKNPRLKVEGKHKGLVVPMILERLMPGDKMILTVNLQIPENFEEENEVHYIILNLNSKGFGDFGRKLVLAYNVDDELFDLKCQIEGKPKYLERVKLSDS